MLLWLCLSVCWATVSTEYIRYHGLNEGDFCKLAAGASWTCKSVKDCPNAAKAIKDGKIPEICGWTPELDTTVCCEPEGGKGAKSKEMCKKYAESVFIRLEDELSEGGIRTYDTCGIGKPNPPRSKRVVDGKEPSSREFPHMALLNFNTKADPFWRCGGALISERFILTTADCSKGTRSSGPPKIARLGDFNIRSETDEDESVSQPSEYEVVEVFTHPDFKPPSVYNDIGLLKLEKDVFFTEFIRPICLQTDHRIPTSYGLATGWGRTEIGGRISSTLQTVNLTIYSHDECNMQYNSSDTLLKNGIIEAEMVCAGDKKGIKDTCQGDGGSPLQILLEEPYCMYSQVGITSFGPLKCGNGKPSVYTRVSHYVPWIESIVWP